MTRRRACACSYSTATARTSVRWIARNVAELETLVRQTGSTLS
jgi:hypothetical protein